MDNDAFLISTLVFGGLMLLVWRFARMKWLRFRVPQMEEPGSLIIDVRSRAEHLNAVRDRSINYPLEQLGKLVEKLDRNRPIVLCCETGWRSKIARTILEERGFKNIGDAGSCSSTVVD